VLKVAQAQKDSQCLQKEAHSLRRCLQRPLEQLLQPRLRLLPVVRPLRLQRLLRPLQRAGLV
jgi:hypothetical protein